MSEIEETEQRILRALDRIDRALAALATAQPSVDPAEIEALTEQLETERAANAQLEERVIAIKEKQDALVKRLEAEVTQLSEKLAVASAASHRIRSVNGRLRRNNRALREANAQGVGDASLINDGLAAEIDALEAKRAADRAEVDEILTELEPYVEGKKHA